MLALLWLWACVPEGETGAWPVDEMDIEGDAGPVSFVNLASREGCLPAGNYGPAQAADAGVCCPGLHAVAQRVRVFKDDGSSICSFKPVSSLSCVEGICGDGRCEVAEAVPCGCSLDCAVED